MGFYIRELTRKKANPRWKLQYVSYRKHDTASSRAEKPKRAWDIPRQRYTELGFRVTMSVEAARIRQKQLNSQLALKRWEEKRRLFDEKAEGLKLLWDSYLPEALTDEFESMYVANPRLFPRKPRPAALTQWRSAQKLVLELKLDPSDWYDQRAQFYDWLYEKQYSFSYIRKILRMVNHWGYFVCRKQGKSYYRIPVPSGFEKRRLLDAYFDKCGSAGRQSAPLLPAQLESARPKLKEEHYHWLYLTIWLGLRPMEVDQLKQNDKIQYLFDPMGTPILSVYQSKLMSVPPRYRWKLIPAFLREQKRALKIIKGANFERPPTYLVKKLFGPHTSLYGGRKGFTDLMLSLDQSLDHISQWMGHSTLQRTWHHYKNRLRVHYKSAA